MATQLQIRANIGMRFCLNLAKFFLLADILSIKLISKASSNLSYLVQTITQTVEILLNSKALSNKKLQN